MTKRIRIELEFTDPVLGTAAALRGKADRRGGWARRGVAKHREGMARQRNGKAKKTPETDAAKGDIRDFDDTREKLIEDIADMIGAESLYRIVVKWLNRQAAITEREWLEGKKHIFGMTFDEVRELKAERDKWVSNAEVGFERIKELEAERDALQEKVDELELRERCASDYDFRQAAERWEEAFEDKCEELLQMEAERDSLLEQLNRVWLKDADGNPLHIGESRYGQDGTGWRVTWFRWGSSHPVQGVDKEGRRRDLRPEWLTREEPDGWQIATRIDSRSYRLGDAHGDFVDSAEVQPWERTVPRLIDKRGYSQKGAPVEDARPIVSELLQRFGSFAAAERECGVDQSTLRGIAMKRHRTVHVRVYERLLEWKAGSR